MIIDTYNYSFEINDENEIDFFENDEFFRPEPDLFENLDGYEKFVNNNFINLDDAESFATKAIDILQNQANKEMNLFIDAVESLLAGNASIDQTQLVSSYLPSKNKYKVYNY